MDFDTTEQLRQMATRPADPKPPENDRSAWGAPWRAVKGATAQAAGSMADVLKGFGAASAMALEADPLARAAVGERAVREGAAEARRQIDSGEALTSEGFGRSFRNVERDLRPDPTTASTAEQIVYGVVRPVAKLVAGGLVAGPFGIAGASLEEGFSQADDLRLQGVDLATRSKIGALSAGVNAAGAFLPMAGPTLKATAGLYLAGGPGAFMAQQQVSREILQHAGYGEIAQQFDPLDPVGLALSALIPLPFAAYGAARNIRSAKAARAGERAPAAPQADPMPAVPQEVVDAAMVQNLSARADVHDAVGPDAQRFLMMPRRDEPVPGLRPLEASVLDDATVLDPAARASSMPAAQAVDEAVFLVGARQFDQLAAPRAEPRQADLFPAEAAARVEALARRIVDFYDRNPPEPPTPAAPRPAAPGPVARAASAAEQQPGAAQTRAPLSREKLGGLELQPKDGTDAHLRSVAERVKIIEQEAPDAVVRKTEDGTPVTAREELAQIRKLAAEGTDDELGTLDADLIRVAAECALSVGTA